MSILHEEIEVQEAELTVSEVKVTFKVEPTGAETEFRISKDVSLIQLFKKGAKQTGISILPPGNKPPLDTLHNESKDGAVGPAIEDLNETVGEYLQRKKTTKRFVMVLQRAFHVNARWAVASDASMTPREIMALPSINMDPASFTLYPVTGSDPYPIDTPIEIDRGDKFEAQKDGKYGA